MVEYKTVVEINKKSPCLISLFSVGEDSFTTAGSLILPNIEVVRKLSDNLVNILAEIDSDG